MTDYNPRGFISAGSLRACIIWFVAGVIVFLGAFIVGFVIGRATG